MLQLLHADYFVIYHSLSLSLSGRYSIFPEKNVFLAEELLLVGQSVRPQPDSQNQQPVKYHM